MSEIVIYQVEEGKTTLEVQLEKDTVWLNQAQMAELFGRERSVITKHLGNVFREGELNKIAMCKICTLQIPTDRSLGSVGNSGHQNSYAAFRQTVRGTPYEDGSGRFGGHHTKF